MFTQLLHGAPTIPTVLGKELLKRGLHLVGSRHKEMRAPTWRDVTTQEGLDYSKRSTKFALRGNHIWYLVNTAGPKEMAKELLNNRFSFKSGEKWYKSNFGKAGRNHADWARNVLGLDKENKAIDSKTIQKIAEENPMAPAEVKTKDDIYGMKSTGKGVAGSAQPRDIISSSLGHIEETEQPIGAHHGLPDSVFDENGELNKSIIESAEAFKTFMNDVAVAELNDYVKRIFDIEDKKFNKHFKKIMDEATKRNRKQFNKNSKSKNVEALIIAGASNANRKMANEGLRKFNLSQARFIRHNVDIVSNTLVNSWKEGYPVGPRNKETGHRDYMSVELAYNNMEFSVIGVKKINAVSHIAGLYAGDDEDKKKKAADHYINQQIHYMQGKGTNVGLCQTTNNMTTQALDVAKSGIKHTTNVRFSPKQTEQWLDELSNQIGKKLTDNISAKSQEVKNKVFEKARQQHGNSGMFWAMPYIGVEEGLFIAK